MFVKLILLLPAALFFFSNPLTAADKYIFEDNFDNGLSDRWEIVGLEKEDYRIRKGGLEMRVQPGDLTNKTPRLEFKHIINTPKAVTASVDVTILDEFTNPKETAGLCLLKKERLSFRVRKQLLDNKLVYSPGKLIFNGESIEKDDKPENYSFEYDQVKKYAGPLRIIVRGDYAYFQVGPSSTGKYRNYFHTAISKNKSGFCLVAAGAPKNSNHWVRFDNFRITN
jgi:hypothetical protein